MEWYYARGDMQRGPVSERELQALIEDGIIKPETRVWREGMNDWLPYSKVADSAEPTEADSTPTSSTSFSHSATISYNGKEYQSLDDMPAEARRLFEKLDTQSFVHEPGETSKTIYEYNGKQYDSFEDMPPEAQEMLRDDNNNGIPDMFEN